MFPDILKVSSITPTYKNLDPSDKANHRPVKILFLILTFQEKDFVWPTLCVPWKLSQKNFYVASLRLLHATCYF